MIPQVSLAATEKPFKGFLDFLPAACMEKGNCSLDDVAQGFVLLTKWLIGSVGAIALLYFIWGGIQWITSYGNLEKVRQGREIMTNTIIALVVAFGSFLLVEFFINHFLLGLEGNQTSTYQVETKCSQDTQGTSCNRPGEINYVCTGHSFTGELADYNGLCVSRCELMNITDSMLTWACLPRNSTTALQSTNLLEYCPDSGDVCVGSSS